MSVSVKFNSNLRKLKEEIRKKGLAHADKVLVDRVSAVVCPVHGKGPTSVVKVRDDRDSHGFKIEGCCEELISAVRAALRKS